VWDWKYSGLKGGFGEWLINKGGKIEEGGEKEKGSKVVLGIK